MILLPETERTEAVTTAERIASHTAASSWPKAEPLSLSMGIASVQAGETAESLFEKADAALYQAKRQGKDSIVQVP